ncbi:hypothetical protein ATCC90586_011522 [Pythium insidiosum]|nr:hypothetical protein ATCC90586_011522 [Pythium insidiosum]
METFFDEELARLRPSADSDAPVMPGGADDAFQMDGAVQSDVLARLSSQVQQLSLSSTAAAAPREVVGRLSFRRLVDPLSEPSIAIDIVGSAITTPRQLVYPHERPSLSSHASIASRMESIMISDPTAVKRDERLHQRSASSLACSDVRVA